MRRFGRGAALLLALAVAPACGRRAEPAATLELAVTAHGGRERLARLDNLKVVSRGAFKGQVPFTRTLYFRAPATWTMELEAGPMGTMRFGVDGGACWRKDRSRVSACSDSDRKEYDRTTSVLNARLLHRLDAGGLAAQDSVDVAGVAAPAVRSGDLVLAFHPASHELVQIRYDDATETFADFRAVEGAVVGAKRTLVIHGELDVEETWSEIVPGGADPAHLAALEPSRDGSAVDDLDPERLVVWTEIADLAGGAAPALEALERFARARGQGLSHSDGVLLTALHEDTAPPERQRWQLALTLEAGAPFSAAAEGALHLERWPPAHVAGVFYGGDPRALTGRREAVERWMAGRGLTRAAGARWQIACPQESLARPDAASPSLLRVVVENRSPP